MHSVLFHYLTGTSVKEDIPEKSYLGCSLVWAKKNIKTHRGAQLPRWAKRRFCEGDVSPTIYLLRQLNNQT